MRKLQRESGIILSYMACRSQTKYHRFVEIQQIRNISPWEKEYAEQIWTTVLKCVQ